MKNETEKMKPIETRQTRQTDVPAENRIADEEMAQVTGGKYDGQFGEEYSWDWYGKKYVY